jgi:hypothetical protein
MEDDFTDLEKLAREATPGPWVSFDFAHKSSVYTMGNDGFMLATAHSYSGSAFHDTRPNKRQRNANAAYIAAANPARVLALCAELSRLRSQVEEMRGALEFYADAANWRDFIARPPQRDSYYHSAHAHLDKGKRAAQALKGQSHE